MMEAATAKPSGNRVRRKAGRASIDAFPQTPQLDVERKCRSRPVRSIFASGRSSTRTTFRSWSDPAGGPQCRML